MWILDLLVRAYSHPQLAPASFTHQSSNHASSSSSYPTFRCPRMLRSSCLSIPAYPSSPSRSSAQDAPVIPSPSISSLSISSPADSCIGHPESVDSYIPLLAPTFRCPRMLWSSRVRRSRVRRFLHWSSRVRRFLHWSSRVHRSRVRRHTLPRPPRSSAQAYHKSWSPRQSLASYRLTPFGLSQTSCERIVNFPVSTDNPQFLFSSKSPRPCRKYGQTRSFLL